MKYAKVFKSGNSQAVRLPRDFQTKESEFFIRKSGSSLILTPKSDPWSTFTEALSEFSDDFFADRNQPAVQQRDDI